jgi:4-hydroxy-tetrahydrodipicolinate synthase
MLIFKFTLISHHLDTYYFLYLCVYEFYFFQNVNQAKVRIMRNIFKGTGTALVTPFIADGSIDFDGLRKLVRLNLAGGLNFLVVQGTTGESPTLNDEEKMQILQTVVEENNGAVPIVYGVGGNNTKSVVEQFKKLNKTSVQGILSVSPYYNKPIQSGIVEHYKMLADATDLPIILYNVPGRTGSNVLAETTLQLAEIENVVAMKEASGNMEQIMQIIKNKPDGFDVLSGDDALTVPMISVGAAGVISVVSNALPEKFSQMVQAALHGDFAKASKIHYDLFEITQLFFAEGNPGGVKEALKFRGICQNYMRLPLVNVSNNLSNRIVKEMLTLML